MHEQDTDCDDPGAPARDGGGAKRTHPGAGGAGGGAGSGSCDAAGDLERALSAGLFPSFAEPRFGPSWQFLSELAAEYGIWLSGGSIAEREDGKVYNTAYVFDRSGKEAARHRKMHLFDIQITGGQHFMESATLTAGDRVTVFDTEFCKMGLCICYDARFPELFRLMVDRGAKLILVPAAFNLTTGPAHWELLFRQRAVDNQVFCVATSPARDMAAGYHAWGHSIVTDPWGRVVTQMEEAEGIRFVELDLDLVDQIRAELPLLAHRRTDVYRLEHLGSKREYGI